LKPKGCFLLIITVVVVVIKIALFSQQKNKNYIDPYFQKIRTGVLGKISFKGRVINYIKIHSEEFGKDYSVICIKLDYSNTDSFYYFQDKNALKIKNGIATMSDGGYDPNFIPIYVENNMNNNHKIIVHYADSGTGTVELNYNSTGISKEDMNLCN
jgi:hypothetical protein